MHCSVLLTPTTLSFRMYACLSECSDTSAERLLELATAKMAHCRFASEAGRTSLLRVLRAYAVYDTEVGYCQGMNFLAGLLLTWMPNEATAFAGLVVLMQQQGLRDLYKSDLARLQVVTVPPFGLTHKAWAGRLVTQLCIYTTARTYVHRKFNSTWNGCSACLYCGAIACDRSAKGLRFIYLLAHLGYRFAGHG